MYLSRYLLVLLFLSQAAFVKAAEKDSSYYYNLPDSVKAVAFIADISVNSTGKKESYAGITVSGLSLLLEADKKEREVAFEYPSSATLIVAGQHTEKEKRAVEWEYDWKENTTYKLLIASAGDSVQNFALYSGYIFLPEQKQWKLVGTVRMDGRWNNTMQQPGTVHSTGKNSFSSATFTNAWAQRATNGWKALSEGVTTTPVLNPMLNVDSVAQFATDKLLIEQAMVAGTLEKMSDTAGVYYFIKDPGNGLPINVTDTVSVHYRLTLFPTNALVEDSQAGDKKEPATFPLNRLIKGWQLAIPKIKTGGQVRIVIPSGLAYSIRTRSPRIPPNSILIFDVQVLGAKSKQ